MAAANAACCIHEERAHPANPPGLGGSNGSRQLSPSSFRPEPVRQKAPGCFTCTSPGRADVRLPTDPQPPPGRALHARGHAAATATGVPGSPRRQSRSAACSSQFPSLGNDRMASGLSRRYYDLDLAGLRQRLRATSPTGSNDNGFAVGPLCRTATPRVPAPTKTQGGAIGSPFRNTGRIPRIQADKASPASCRSVQVLVWPSALDLLPVTLATVSMIAPRAAGRDASGIAQRLTCFRHHRYLSQTISRRRALSRANQRTGG